MLFLGETTTVAPPLGVVLLIIAALFLWSRSRGRKRDMSRVCPHCKERMRGDASVCPHCQRESTPWTLHDGRWWRQDAAGQWEYLRSTGDGGVRWERFAAKREP